MKKEEAIKELLKKGIIPTVENFNNIDSGLKTNVEVVKNYNYEPHKIVVREFIEANRAKYSILRNMLMNRAELQNAISISRLSQMSEKSMTVIGMVFEISKLQTGTYKLVIEDLSGRITAIVSKNNEELLKKISFVTNDEVLGFIGSYAKDVFFINDIVWPEIPHKQISTCEDDVYIAFISDIHVGSNMFLDKEFSDVISWFSGEFGDEQQKDIASKIKYIIITGDVVDGVGIYPQQDRELHIKDIYEQYNIFTDFLSKIPSDKQIIICPGNHDGVRLEDPKPKITKKLAPKLHEMSNVKLVTNPAIVNSPLSLFLSQ